MKEFLSQRGIPYVERDVSSDMAASQEMYRLTGQMGVPVTVIDGTAIVGFDQQGLEHALLQSRAAPVPERPSFGLKVGDASRVLERRGQEPQPGAYVAGVAPNSPAGRAGLRAGDIVVEFNGMPVSNAEDLQRGISAAMPRSRVSIIVLRGDARIRADTSI